MVGKVSLESRLISSVTNHHLIPLLEFGDHDDDGAVLLPGHLPEVVHRVDHRTLGGDVRFLVSEVTL